MSDFTSSIDTFQLKRTRGERRWVVVRFDIVPVRSARKSSVCKPSWLSVETSERTITHVFRLPIQTPIESGVRAQFDLIRRMTPFYIWMTAEGDCLFSTDLIELLPLDIHLGTWTNESSRGTLKWVLPKRETESPWTVWVTTLEEVHSSCKIDGIIPLGGSHAGKSSSSLSVLSSFFRTIW